MDIEAFTKFTLNEDDTELKATVTFGLDEQLGICTEHLQVSTAFSDYYNFYVWHGQKEINLTFTDSWEIADIRMNGLRFFTYCADPFTMLQSSVTTAFMWIGGNGANKYLPALGDKPTIYQKDANSNFIEQFGGIRLQERIINRVSVDQSLMKTGDILVGRRFSGSAAEWMLLSGGFANHIAMVVVDDRGLTYVIDCPTEIGVFAKESGVT